VWLNAEDEYMTVIQQAEEFVAKLSRAEKARLVEQLIRELSDAFPGIEQSAGVVGGAPCIVGTRISVWSLAQYRNLGATDLQLLQMYPTLTAQDVANAWAYYTAHKQAVDLQIVENETA
jgi:uncharacterized protein (DUF433 family)